MPGLGEFFSVACALSWALGVVLFRRADQNMPAFEMNFVKNTVGVALLLPTALAFEGLVLPDYSAQEWLVTLLSGVLGIAVADTWYLRALTLLGASRMGIVASLYSPFVIGLSAIFLGEKLQGWQYLGFILVMTGILLVTWKQHRGEVSSEELKKGVLYGAGAVFLTAAGVLMVKGILQRHEFFWTAEIRLLGGMAGMLVYLSLRREWSAFKVNLRKPQPWGTILLASFLAAYLSMIMWLAGYKLINPAVSSVLNESASAFIVLLAWLILKEPLSRRKLLGLLVTLSGVLLVLLG